MTLLFFLKTIMSCLEKWCKHNSIHCVPKEHSRNKRRPTANVTTNNYSRTRNESIFWNPRYWRYPIKKNKWLIKLVKIISLTVVALNQFILYSQRVTVGVKRARDRFWRSDTSIWKLYFDKKLGSMIHRKQLLQRSSTAYQTILLSYKKY
jgi:hypothetical protein